MIMKRFLSVLAAFAMTAALTFTASAESTQFKMQDDFESYKESSDFCSTGPRRGNAIPFPWSWTRTAS